MSNSTYLFRLVRKVLDQYAATSLTYKPLVHPRSVPLYYDSCRIFFPNSDITISLQTNPDIAGSALCETAIMSPKGAIEIKELGYDGCIHHDTAEDLDHYLFDLCTMIPGKNLSDFTVVHSDDSE